MVINVQYGVHTYSINTITLTSLYSNCPTRSEFITMADFSVRQMIVTKRKTFFFFTKTQNRHFNIYIPEKCT